MKLRAPLLALVALAPLLYAADDDSLEVPATNSRAKSYRKKAEKALDRAQDVVLAVERGEQAHVEVPPKLESLASESQRLLRKSLDCYAETDAELARRVLEQDDLIDASEERVIRDAVTEIAAHPELSVQEVELILIAKNLERVGDHATNIAEEVILMQEALNMKHAEKLREAAS